METPKNKMKLFGRQADCNTRILKALLKEVDLEVDYVELGEGDRKSCSSSNQSEYDRLCPYGAVPCLVDEDKVVYGQIDVFA